MKNLSLSARQLADQLLFPGPFDGGLASGMFVQVCSSEESTQFLGDLAPMLEASGMLVEVIDAAQLLAADGLQHLAQRLRVRCGIESATGFKMDELTLSDALASIMNHLPRTVALLIGSAQRLSTEPGERVLKAIKAARDRVNLHPASAEKLLLVATWILPANPSHYVENARNAFYGANAVSVASSN